MKGLSKRGFFMGRRQNYKKTFDTICKEAVKMKEMCREGRDFVSEKWRKLLKGLKCLVYEKKDTTSHFSNKGDEPIINTPVRRNRMISMEGTNMGITFKKLRQTKGMSLGELSAAVGISESHLKKIEAGIRQPGIKTHQRMIAVLEVDIVINNAGGTVKGECTARAQKVFLESTEAQALYLVKVLEYMAHDLRELD